MFIAFLYINYVANSQGLATNVINSQERTLHKDILIEAISSQIVCATYVSSDDQGFSQLSASVTEFEMKLKFFKVIKISVML